MYGVNEHRLSPDELLRRVEAAEGREHRGRLKIFLGYAPRVGKSARMFDEARRRKSRGQDVVLASTQSDVPASSCDTIRDLEAIPPTSGALDVAAIVQRRPEVCLIDPLAYRNPPGSLNAERWQDVEEILRAGISVIAAVNVQCVLDQQSAVERITGKRASTAVPGKFLREADEIEVVDAPQDHTMGDPRALAELRKLALLLAADVVDHQLRAYMDLHGVAASWGTQERIMVCLTPHSNARAMLESGQRNARRFHGVLLAAYVEQAQLDRADESRIRQHLELAKQLGAEVHRLHGGDFINTLLNFARRERITQLFLGHSLRERSPVEKLIDAAEDFDVRLFPQGGGT